jgi:hypothetical protein
MKMYEIVEIHLHAFLASALGGGAWPEDGISRQEGIKSEPMGRVKR